MITFGNIFMKILIIAAHPSSAGFTQKIAGAYAEEKQRRGAETEIINLYQEENRQDF